MNEIPVILVVKPECVLHKVQLIMAEFYSFALCIFRYAGIVKLPLHKVKFSAW